MDYELSSLRESKQHLELARQVIREVDSRTDSELFMEYNKKNWDEPPDFVFEDAINHSNNVCDNMVWRKIYRYIHLIYLTAL